MLFDIVTDCTACLIESTVSNRSITTGSWFYEECCCSDDSSMVKELTWLDPYNRVISGYVIMSNTLLGYWFIKIKIIIRLKERI